jgi:hypothetical protein
VHKSAQFSDLYHSEQIYQKKKPYEYTLQIHKIGEFLEREILADAPVLGWGSQCTVERLVHDRRSVDHVGHEL